MIVATNRLPSTPSRSDAPISDTLNRSSRVAESSVVSANDTTMVATNATARLQGTPSSTINVAVPLMNAPSLFDSPTSIVFQSR